MTISPKLFLAVSISSCFCTVVDIEHNNSTSYLWQTGRARFLLTSSVTHALLSSTLRLVSLLLTHSLRLCLGMTMRSATLTRCSSSSLTWRRLTANHWPLYPEPGNSVHEYIKYISHCESFVTHSGFSRVLATYLSTNSCKPLTSSGRGNFQGT